MKFNIADPQTGGQKLLDIEDERKIAPFLDKRMSQEVAGDSLGEEFKGYVFKITGGNDKQGFPMMQGIMSHGRVRLLFSKGMSCYRPRRTGERKRKSVRGCITGSDLSVMNLVVVRRGAETVPGLNDVTKPVRLGPKRASKIRKLFNLSKEDNVCDYVVRRDIMKGDKKVGSKAPAIQRLVTPQRLQRKRALLAERKERKASHREAAAEYQAILAQRIKEQREKRAALVLKRKVNAIDAATAKVAAN
ncbi:40S ribosomal protein S6 [Fonticula alba]|uniref:40S ribosomal protein S6 n=1 Tax=Fonticula alba TaxID=691883 RepID=A0A058ZHJ2_FONAL|nr:40S ribosomal protein S6 [Fonticula alba]KCV73408.1 40S ribosomal protein S6 [Fonticula alba]|eukprot:XP_009493109.1 40S ribosomal protein S6 [Fonticula alba]